MRERSSCSRETTSFSSVEISKQRNKWVRNIHVQQKTRLQEQAELKQFLYSAFIEENELEFGKLDS